MAKAPRSLAGKVVAITGAARGIGRATATALVAQGARVAIGDLDLPLAEQTAAQLGSGAIALSLDVTDRASFTRFIAQVEERLGPLDVLINNAGIMPVGPFVAETDGTAQRLVDINLHGVIIGSKLALTRFLPRGRGHLVNIASAAGKLGFPGGATYCATKHAVVGLSEAIRAEVRRTDIDVTIVMPVVVNTELGSGLNRARGVQVIEPEDVADAIVEALQTGRVDVYIPRSRQGLFRFKDVIPRAMSDWIFRTLRADRVLVDPDHVRRGAYERRTAELGAPAADTPGAGTPAADVPAAQTPDRAGSDPTSAQAPATV